MTAPSGGREYIAQAGGPYTNADAAIIGPQIEALAAEGNADESHLRDVARSSNSPLHRYFEWDKDIAADKWQLHQAGTMLRSIKVKIIDDGRPKVVPAYKVATPPRREVISRGYNVLHGETAAAVHKAKSAMDDLTAWRARYSPFVQVWKDFGEAFRGVANQVSEAEDVVNTTALDDRTDVALTDLNGLLADLRAWREQHAPVAEEWIGIAEQAEFVMEAIDGAVQAFTVKQGAKERPCLRCETVFMSGGVDNRLCERCSALSAISTS